MKTALALLLLLVASPAWAFTTVAEYQADFTKARECKPIEGRKVWAGETAYYIQSTLFWTDQSGLLDDESADAVPIKDNDKLALSSFVEACK